MLGAHPTDSTQGRMRVSASTNPSHEVCTTKPRAATWTYPGGSMATRKAALLLRKNDPTLLDGGAGSPPLHVLRVSYVHALERVVETERVSCVVTELRDADGVRVDATLRRIHERFPALPVLVSMPFDPDAMREVVDIVARIGPIRLVIRPFEDLASAMLQAAAVAPEEPATRALLALLGRYATRSLQRVIEVVSEVPHTAPSVTEVCRRAHLPRRTINDRLRRAGLPTLERLLGWSRVLHALWRIDGGHSKVDAVSVQLGFNSGSALRHMVKRYTGLAPSQIHAVGGFDYALPLLEAELASGTAATRFPSAPDR